MTGYYIEVGYNSCNDNDEVWKTLKEKALYLKQHPEIIIENCFVIEGRDDEEEIREGGEHYKNCNDLTLKIIEESENNVITQYASGGGASRDIKEKLRRAFCRCIMNEMHKLGMEININVG